MHYHYTISGNDFSQAGDATAEIKKTLQTLGIASEIIKRATVAMYEAEINMVVHAGGGEAEIDIDSNAITIIMHDSGPGISDIALAMEEGYSTAPQKIQELGFGAGMGLSNMKSNTDELYIESHLGEGTTVTMRIKIAEQIPHDKK